MKYIRFELSSFFLLFLLILLLILSFCFMNDSGEELYLVLSNISSIIEFCSTAFTKNFVIRGFIYGVFR